MDELLDILARRTNCFISDLRSDTNYLKIKSVLLSIEESNYSLLAWKDAYNYIIGKIPIGDTVETIKNEMIQHLQIK